MPQRAVIYEESGKQDVLAYELSDEHWYGIVEAAQANKLKLPCCGVNALPKNSEIMVRHFAHPPYTLDNCHAKQKGDGHDSIVASVALMAVELGWKITPEAKFDDTFCDIVCEREASGLRIGFEFETATRSAATIEQVDKQLSGKAVDRLYWFFKKGRRGGLPYVKHSNLFSAAEADNGAAFITSRCRNILGEIEEVIALANGIMSTLNEEQVEYQLNMEDGIPESLTTYPEGKQRPHKIRFKPEGPEIEIPDTPINEGNFEQGEKTAKAQETLISIVRKNLKEGRSVWWDGHPNLLKDSFKRLREEIARVKRQREAMAEYRRKRKKETQDQSNFFSSEQHTTPNSTIGRPQEISEEKEYNSIGLSFEAMRLKEMKAFMKVYFGPDYNDIVLDTQMAELGGFSPRELVSQGSQSLERIQVALGYRDPISKAPIKPIPALKIE